MKDYAYAFYHSMAWRRLQANVIKERKGLCEVCLKQGIYKPAEIVHHIEHITPDNIENTAITLNKDNLMAVCRDCHAALHKSKKRYVFDENGNVIASPM